MAVFQIKYETLNTYSSPAPEAILEFLVLPAQTDNQEIIEYSYEASFGAIPYLSQNSFGFDVLRFRLKNIEGEFKFVLNATVNKEPVNPFDFIPMEIEIEKRIRESNSFLIDYYPFLNFGENTRLPGNFIYPEIDETESLFDFVKRVNQFVHSRVRFDNSVTDPHRLLEETIQEKKGVCQDFTHLMLAILRKNNVPCRYISGYLHPGEHFSGTGAVHAWVQAMIPGAGWIGFDPTNNLLEDSHFIKIAHGVDITDCPTLKGVIKGVGTNQTSYQVLVEEQIKDQNQ